MPSALHVPSTGWHCSESGARRRFLCQAFARHSGVSGRRWWSRRLRRRGRLLHRITASVPRRRRASTPGIAVAWPPGRPRFEVAGIWHLPSGAGRGVARSWRGSRSCTRRAGGGGRLRRALRDQVRDGGPPRRGRHVGPHPFEEGGGEGAVPPTPEEAGRGRRDVDVGGPQALVVGLDGRALEKYVHSARRARFAPPSTVRPSEVITWKNAHPPRRASMAHACSSTARGLAVGARWPSSSAARPPPNRTRCRRGEQPRRGALIAGHAASAAMTARPSFSARGGGRRVSLAPLPARRASPSPPGRRLAYDARADDRSPSVT